MLSAFYLRVFFAWLLLFWPPYQTQNQLICCQLSWKEPYLDFGSYLDFQGSGRGFFYQDFVQQYQRGKPGHKCKVRAHLVIKGVSKKKIFTLELMCICLFHEKTVLLSFKQFSFITYSSPPLLSFPFLSTVTLVLHSQISSGGFFLVRVVIDNQRKPNTFQFFFRKGVEEWIVLQIVEGKSVINPLKSDLKFEFYRVFVFFDFKKGYVAIA